MTQYDDPHGDYIWCIFHKKELNDDISTIIEYIMNEDQQRFW